MHSLYKTDIQAPRPAREASLAPSPRIHGPESPVDRSASETTRPRIIPDLITRALELFPSPRQLNRDGAATACPLIEVKLLTERAATSPTVIAETAPVALMSSRCFSRPSSADYPDRRHGGQGRSRVYRDLEVMPWLADIDVGAARGFARALSGARTVTELRPRALSGLAELVPADLVMWDRVELATGVVRHEAVPADAEPPGAFAAIGDLTSHPLLSAHAARRRPALRLSEAVEPRHLFRSELYGDLLHLSGVEYCITIGFRAERGETVVAGLGRSERQFSEPIATCSISCTLSSRPRCRMPGRASGSSARSPAAAASATSELCQASAAARLP
jgi:hypothetical protein